MEIQGREKDTVVTQVSLGGFGRSVSVEDLVKYLDKEVGLVCRCRLKTSWTPLDSYPEFSITSSHGISISDEYNKVEPHAFVHFVSPDSAYSAYDAAKKGDLFMNGQPLKVSLGPENPFSINQRRRTSIPFKISDVDVQIGILTSLQEFMVGWRGPPDKVDFFVDHFDGTCRLCFQKDTVFSYKDTGNFAVIKCDFKVEFMVRDINEIKQYANIGSHVVLLQLASSPRLYYRTADDRIEDLVSYDLLDDDDPWIRTTDFTVSGAIGRCSYYRISIPAHHGPTLNKALTYLKERRVEVINLKGKKLKLQLRDEPNFGNPMRDVLFSVHKSEIDFDILYLLNAAVHKNIFNEHQLSEDLYGLLRRQSKEVNFVALKNICTYKRPVLDACDRLDRVQKWLLKNPKLLRSQKQFDDIVPIRRVVITPSKAYCLPPEVELSNRVLRNFKDVEDRFLRVTFMDEGLQTLNPSVLNYYVAPILKDLLPNFSSQRTTVFKRLRKIMSGGFYLCGRKYSFLAFSSNQLRDRSAWFFAETKKLSVHDIKAWMGKFINKNVAKCAARMGQCFSSTYATVEVPAHKVNFKLPDVERNNYVFSDGIGMITPDLAKEVAAKLRLEGTMPCAYQIRYAGYKGVIACWPGKSNGIELSLRNSMNKFESQHNILEICSWTRFQPGFLNRQIVTLLSTLNVPDEVFWDMQQTMILKLNQMLADTDVAFDVLMSSCAELSNTAALMLSAGFKPQLEPHLRGILTCVRAEQFWGLREKARIFVPSGRWLMGCFDELGVLEQGQCFIQVSVPTLENCFIKHGSRFSETKNNLQVVRGTVVVAKNPCLHPGDIRILEAVDDPSLHHLYDCLVFPQKGDRPHSNEASGSDLDGDLYFVTWDENLIPPSKKSWPPMQYDAAEEKKRPSAVTHADLINFFVIHILNENLGPICNAHVVHADKSEHGALDEKCIHLATLAATAVDFPKTGKIVTMPYHLKPKMYPDFMGKEEYQSYPSPKIQGKLYRQILDVYKEDVSVSSEQSSIPEEIPYDATLEVPGADNFISEAWGSKCSYNRQLSGLLDQYKVKHEEEVVTGHVWSMPKSTSRKQGELKERLRHSYSTLRKEFRHVFETVSDSGFEHLNDEEKNLVYEQKASAWYQVTYHPNWVKKSQELQKPDRDEPTSTMLSFAWISADYLARIKIRNRDTANIDMAKPINSLVGYLADRI